jgi:hypothetical protein
MPEIHRLASPVADKPCYLALRRGQDLFAGLWLSHYGLLIGLFLIWKRRWHAVAGPALGGIVVIGGSLLAAGWESVLAYPHALKEMAVFQGYWEQSMITGDPSSSRSALASVRSKVCF